jgi:predicted transcriptional regulator
VQKETVVVGKRILKSQQELPSATGELLKELPLAERKAYATILRNAGWTLQSIATPLGITRESIRLYAGTTHKEETLAKVAHLPVPEVPTVDVYKTYIKRTSPDPKVLLRLKELQPMVQQVRSSSPKFREEAEEYSRLMHETLNKGVSSYRLARLLGITHGAIAFRMVRYGYNTSKGKSGSYSLLKHRKVEGNAELVSE